MDGWQKLEIMSKVVAAVFIPVAIAVLANNLAAANKQRDSETKFVEIATAILSKEPSPSQTPESKSLRTWAVEVIDKFSGVPMPKATAEALIRSTSLPAVNQPAQPTDSEGTWGLIFGGDSSVQAAKQEVTVTAKKMGIGEGSIFRRAGSFRSVKVFESRSDAEDALGKARVVRPRSYLVNMTKWCPTSSDRGGYYECSVP